MTKRAYVYLVLLCSVSVGMVGASATVESGGASGESGNDIVAPPSDGGTHGGDVVAPPIDECGNDLGNGNETVSGLAVRPGKAAPAGIRHCGQMRST